MIAGPSQTFDHHGYIFAAHNAGGARTDRVVVTLDGNADNLEVFAHEYAGLAKGPFDSGQVGSGTSNSTDGVLVAVKVTAAPALVFAFGYAVTAAGHGRLAAGTAMNQRQTAFWGLSEDAILNAPGLASATATMTSGTNSALLVATFAR
jgi:hypothetical protein